jgi:glycogen debranching enzyme
VIEDSSEDEEDPNDHQRKSECSSHPRSQATSRMDTRPDIKHTYPTQDSEPKDTLLGQGSSTSLVHTVATIPAPNLRKKVKKEEPVEIMDIKPVNPVLSFLRSCSPTMECWFAPLVAFGCDSMIMLSTLASWDEDAVKSTLREVANQPGFQQLRQMHILILMRNLKEAKLG